MSYTPVLHDYVKWTNSLGHVTEGWVYFVDTEYITIETGVKDKPQCEDSKTQKHKKIHILVVCYNQFWDQLEYVKNRREDC